MGRDSMIGLALVILVMRLLLVPAVARSADFPKGPTTLIIPWGAGGATDVAFRALCEATKEILGRPIIVENRPGGGSAIGVGSIVGKKPDGYTLVEATNSLHRSAYINKLPFDTVKDLTPVVMVGGLLYGVLVRADSPFKTLKEFIEHARANPGKLTYMASGVGSAGHIAWEETAHIAGGIQVQHIPSKGDQESSAALLGGHVDMIATSGGWVPLVEAGKLRLLATFGEKRSELFPDVPTVKELGYKVVQDSPMVIFGPKGMDPNVVKVLQDAFHKAQSDSRFTSAMAKYGAPIKYMDSQGCAKYWADAYIEAGEQVKKFIHNQ